ncbi:unnamed protein product [Amoebophrya sp. A25]|nr:unnamed protein product [Amoebophrya sp. A25]|eukprot:GSA25T00001839001.1
MSKQFQVFDVGGDVFTLSVTIADGKIIDSKWFRPEESIWLKEVIRNKKIDVVTGMNLQIYLRTIYDPVTMSTCRQIESGQIPMNQVAKLRRGVRFVMFLPGWRTDENLNTSWCFMKFAHHMAHSGFNCIFVDLPGYNKSTVGSQSRCAPEKWNKFDVDIVRVILETLKIPRVQLVCWGDSASIALNCMKRIPKMLANRHVLLAPIVTGMQEPEIAKLMLSTSTTFFLAYDPKSYGDKSREVILFKVKDTLAMFHAIAAKSKLLAHQVNIGHLAAKDLQRVTLSESPDPGLASVNALVPSRYFMIYLEEFLIGTMVGVYNSADLGERLDKLERVKQHMKTQQDKINTMKGSSANEMSQAQIDVLRKMQQQEHQLGAGGLVPTMRKESQFEKYERLHRWKFKKQVPDYSFGVRVLEKNLANETEQALATSLDEYLDTFGAEEDEFLQACDASGKAHDKESKDERLNELRSRAEVDPLEQLGRWQKAAELSYHQFQMEQRTGVEDVQTAMATSRREVDLTSMLTEEERRSRPNNAPASVDVGTFYQPAPQYRWQEAQQRERQQAEQDQERQRAEAQARAAFASGPTSGGPPNADEAVRKALFESEQLERRMEGTDRFSIANQPQDKEDDELLMMAQDASRATRELEKKGIFGPVLESGAASGRSGVASFRGGSRARLGDEEDDDDDIPRVLDGIHRRERPVDSASSVAASECLEVSVKGQVNSGSNSEVASNADSSAASDRTDPARSGTRNRTAGRVPGRGGSYATSVGPSRSRSAHSHVAFSHGEQVPALNDDAASSSGGASSADFEAGLSSSSETMTNGSHSTRRGGHAAKRLSRVASAEFPTVAGLKLVDHPDVGKPPTLKRKKKKNRVAFMNGHEFNLPPEEIAKRSNQRVSSASAKGHANSRGGRSTADQAFAQVHEANRASEMLEENSADRSLCRGSSPRSVNNGGGSSSSLLGRIRRSLSSLMFGTRKREDAVQRFG